MTPPFVGLRLNAIGQEHSPFAQTEATIRENQPENEFIDMNLLAVQKNQATTLNQLSK